jgi:hypothetical protein
VQLTRVTMQLGDAPGRVVLTLDGTRVDTPVAVPVSLTVPLQLNAAS